jgi:hypothetical protein
MVPIASNLCNDASCPGQITFLEANSFTWERVDRSDAPSLPEYIVRNAANGEGVSEGNWGTEDVHVGNSQGYRSDDV